jgi:hypothetical protein
MLGSQSWQQSLHIAMGMMNGHHNPVCLFCVYNASSISKHQKSSALQAVFCQGKLGVQQLDTKAVLGVKQEPFADSFCRGFQYVHGLLIACERIDISILGRSHSYRF